METFIYEKNILIICGVVLIALLSTLYVFNFGFNSKVSDENLSFSEVNEETSSVHFSEMRVSLNELINQSDLNIINYTLSIKNACVLFETRKCIM